ncbi:MAG: HupE/UreJ family protein [Saprospiraceae bacterium]
MTAFQAYFTLGFHHIADINAYDHMLFLAVLCAVYQPENWRKIIVIVTGFTIGHSITLALSVLDIFSLNPQLIEYLIPITIILTGITNLLPADKYRQKTIYVETIFFGFVHGMGFSNFLKASLMEGMEQNIFTPLLAFNLGVEAGQLLIVAIILLISWLVVGLFGLKQKFWRIGISSIGILLALQLIYGLYNA